MGKTLVVILHYNSVQYTDVLYELLLPESGLEYDLHVLNNGSDIGKESKYSTLSLEKNIYFGGALNETFELLINESEYDSLLFLNSDLIVGKNFVSSLRKCLKEEQRFDESPENSKYKVYSTKTYDIVSPSIL